MAASKETEMPELTDEEWFEKAREWFDWYIVSQEDIDFQGTLEGMSDEEWTKNVEFVAECMRAGIKPVRFADVLIEAQKEYVAMFTELGGLDGIRGEEAE